MNGERQKGLVPKSDSKSVLWQPIDSNWISKSWPNLAYEESGEGRGCAFSSLGMTETFFLFRGEVSRLDFCSPSFLHLSHHFDLPHKDADRSGASTFTTGTTPTTTGATT
jgi:hypothetical protein